MNDAYFGQLIRGIHYWSANFLLALIGLHMAQVFFSGGYKAPRELNWVVGVVLLLLVIGLAFTGYVLLWDQDGFWATVRSEVRRVGKACRSRWPAYHLKKKHK